MTLRDLDVNGVKASNLATEMGRISQAFQLDTITPANAHVVADWIKSARALNRAGTREAEPLIGLDIEDRQSIADVLNRYEALLPLPAVIRHDEITPRSWLVYQWLPAGELALLAGAGGTGKSLLALQLCYAVATGTDFLGETESVTMSGVKGRTVYATYEDGADELHRRWNAIHDYRRAEDDEQLQVLQLKGLGGLWIDGRASGVLDRLLSHHCGDASLLVIDNVSRAFTGNENDRSEVSAFHDTLDGFAAQTGCAILLIGHTPKSGAAFSGSTQWVNGCRVVWAMEHQQGNGENTGKYATNLSLFKSNYSRIVTPVWLAYQHNKRAQAGVWYESMNGLGKNSPDWRS